VAADVNLDEEMAQDGVVRRVVGEREEEADTRAPVGDHMEHRRHWVIWLNLRAAVPSNISRNCDKKSQEKERRGRVSHPMYAMDIRAMPP
jgi:hypothetical protein